MFKKYQVKQSLNKFPCYQYCQNALIICIMNLQQRVLVSSSFQTRFATEFLYFWHSLNPQEFILRVAEFRKTCTTLICFEASFSRDPSKGDRVSFIETETI